MNDEFERKPDGGLTAWIETFEAMSEGNSDDTELLMLLIELRSRRELKSEQVPVADVQSVATAIMQTIDAETDKFHSAYTLSELRIAIVTTLTGVFTSPQKPVVLPKSHYVCGCADRFMSAPEVIAAIEAAGGSVKVDL